MTTKADFTDEEWTRLERGPLVAGMAITFADPGGPIEALKESLAAVKTVAEAARIGTGNELVDALAKDVAEKAQKRENPIKGFKPRGTTAGAEILDELRAVDEIVAQKATPEETEAYRKWLLDAAQRTADAAKEGGFLGFNAVRVSEGEQKMLDRLSEVLGKAG